MRCNPPVERRQRLSSHSTSMQNKRSFEQYLSQPAVIDLGSSSTSSKNKNARFSIEDDANGLQDGLHDQDGSLHRTAFQSKPEASTSSGTRPLDSEQMEESAQLQHAPIIFPTVSTASARLHASGSNQDNLSLSPLHRADPATPKPKRSIWQLLPHHQTRQVLFAMLHSFYPPQWAGLFRSCPWYQVHFNRLTTEP